MNKINLSPTMLRRHKAGSRGIAPLNLNLGTRSQWVVKDAPQPLYPIKRTPVLIKLEAGWTPRPAWTVLKTSTDERAGEGEKEVGTNYPEGGPNKLHVFQFLVGPPLLRGDPKKNDFTRARTRSQRPCWKKGKLKYFHNNWYFPSLKILLKW
jgi:hypothetical protein